MKTTFYIFALAIAMLSCIGNNLLAGTPTFGENIARGHFFRSNLVPNYSLTKDPRDNIQLTDGKYADSSFFWTDKKTVGWAGVDKLTITINLGKDQPISGVSLSTAAGTSGVKYPTAIQLSVGTSRSKMHDIGEIISMSGQKLNNNSYNRTKIVVKGLRTHGRYVRFTILDARYVFFDEIEVFAGKPAWLKLPYNSGKSIDMSSPEGLALFKARQRLHKDVKKLTSILQSSPLTAAVKKDLLRQAQQAAAKIDQFKLPADIADFKAIIPFSDIQRKLLAIYAATLRSQNFQPLTIWHKYRYAPLSVWEKPQRQDRPQLQVRMMRNEHRADVINLTNTTAKELTVKFTLNQLPAAIDVRQVEYVDTRELKVTATALTKVMKQGNSYLTTIPAGLTRQLWFTVNSKNIAPGIYRGNIKINAKVLQRSIPFTVKVEHPRFPDQLSLSNFVFDYAANYAYAITPGNRNAVIKDMREHLVNVPVGDQTLAAIPAHSDFDANGRLQKKLDFTAFEHWLKLWPGAKHYFIYLGITTSQTNFAGFKPGTTAFKQAIGDWAAAWDSHLQQRNIKPGRVIFHFLDEPHTTASYKIAEQWISSFKAKSRYVKVFCDPNKLPQHFALAQKAFKKLDIICPLDFRYRLEYAKAEINYMQSFVANPHKALWFYMCFGPSRHFDPLYYRLQPWSAARAGATGSGFWSYSDQRCVNPWNEYYKTTIRSYAMVYLYKNQVTPTKHWEAFREGIEDYEYLQMANKVAPELTKQLISDTLKKSFAVWHPYNIDWMTQNPGIYAEQARIKLLDRITQ